MNRNFPAKKCRVLGAVLFAMMAVSAFAQSDRGHGLIGTWRVTVQIQNCTTGALLGAPFHSMLSFQPGGTMGGTTMNPTFPPGTRTPDFGIWQKNEDETYYAASEAFVLAQAGPFPPGRQRIVQAIQVNKDTFTSAAKVTFYDVNQNAVLSTCALASGTRFN